ncbi:MAG TPA: helix-turn-helix domain-containing protein [Candidatus Limnocylindrales bacterium]|nr:helix-turn-helix domain-containing protein [Candidatus Limnocylindrales bacterium]
MDEPTRNEEGLTPAEELATLRADLRLTTAQLAEVARLPERELVEMEAGQRPVTREFLAELMEELNAKGA